MSEKFEVNPLQVRLPDRVRHLVFVQVNDPDGRAFLTLEASAELRAMLEVAEGQVRAAEAMTPAELDLLRTAPGGQA